MAVTGSKKVLDMSNDMLYNIIAKRKKIKSKGEKRKCWQKRFWKTLKMGIGV